MTKQSIKDYAVIVKDTPLELRQQLYKCLEDNDQVIYKNTDMNKEKRVYPTYFNFNSYDWCLTNNDMCKEVVTIEEFLKLFDKQQLQESKYSIGSKFKNSVRAICTITKYNPKTKIYSYLSGTSTTEYSTSEANINKNWKLIPEPEAHQSVMESKVTIKKQSSYKIGDKVKIREDLNRHGNATAAMCDLAGTVVTITSPKGKVRNGYEFKEFGNFYWSDDMFEGLVIEETTQPKFKVGDLVELIPDYKQGLRYNDVTLAEGYMIHNIKPGTSRVTSVQSDNVVTLSNGFSYGEDCLKLYEPKTNKKQINQLAFFKESGEPWTEYELDKVRDYCGDIASRAPMGPSTPNRKYAYYANPEGSLKVYLWDNQTYPEKLEQISYESIFGTSTKKQTKTNIESKSTKGAQTEPIKQPKPNKKEEGTFMSKLKNTALATVEQNKEVAIIAAKMEAGRAINKQVIKQATKHVPFWAKGYLDTPLAPVILANAVAMLGNHTENKRVQKIAELMLLAAADTTVQSFNLDKIIDDVLSNIKLPAGILDADEE